MNKPQDPNSYEWLDKLIEDDCRQDVDSNGNECNVITELFIADLKAKHEAEVTAARIDECEREIAEHLKFGSVPLRLNNRLAALKNQQGGE